MKTALLDLLDRVAWTFFQALGGVAAAGATATSLGVPPTDWRSALVGALVAAVLAALKALGVRVSQLAGAATALRLAERIPAVHDAVTRVEATPVGAVVRDVAAGVLAAEQHQTTAPAPAPTTSAAPAP